jgi:hypothetical protein
MRKLIPSSLALTILMVLVIPANAQSTKSINIETKPPEVSIQTSSEISSDEDFCHRIGWTQNEGCESSRCEVLPACPICLGGFSCHAKGFHKPVGTKYDPPLNTGTEVRKIEIKSTDGETKRIEIKDPTGITKPGDPSSVYIITKDPEKCKPVPCKTLTIKKEGASIVIGDSGVEAKTILPIRVEEDKISVEVKGQTKTVILPSEVKKIVETRPEVQGPLPTKISRIELQRCEPKPGPERSCAEESAVYKIEVEKENKFLGVVSVKSKLNYEVGAVDGKIITETKPWYLRIAPFLFKF